MADPQGWYLHLLKESYLDVFAPIPYEGRLYAIDGYFGARALFDLHRICEIADPLK